VLEPYINKLARLGIMLSQILIEGFPMNNIEARSTAFERLLSRDATDGLRLILDRVGVWDIVEISRDEDVPKLLDTLKTLPDSSRCSYLIAILEVWDNDQ
jgi:hypothetical protein